MGTIFLQMFHGSEPTRHETIQKESSAKSNIFYLTASNRIGILINLPEQVRWMIDIPAQIMTHGLGKLVMQVHLEHLIIPEWFMQFSIL